MTIYKNIGITFGIQPDNIKKIHNIISNQLNYKQLDDINKIIVFTNGFLYNAISLYNQLSIMNESNVYNNNPILLMDSNTYSLFKEIKKIFKKYNKNNKQFIFDFFNINFELFNAESISQIDFLIELDRINHDVLDFKDIRIINPNIKIIAYKITNEYTLLNNNFVFNTKMKNSISYDVFYYKNQYDYIIEINNHYADCYLLYQNMFQFNNGKINSHIDFTYDYRILDFFDKKRFLNKEELNIAICESNITYGKTFLNSLLLAELLYKKIKQDNLNINIGKIYLFNCKYIQNNKSFLNILHELTLFKDNKIIIENEYCYFIDLVKKYHINTVISLNQNNDMNYLYFDCFQYKINLIHNSMSLNNIINENNLIDLFYYNHNNPNKSISDILFNLSDTNDTKYQMICNTCLDNVSVFNLKNNLILKDIFNDIDK